mmetsp:Transcript_123488/g.357061  ORF Transcript_123488/g.357061 Transcript_123488/m.357061 type:complete len:88 (-) Transcript_123488:25-288(-)
MSLSSLFGNGSELSFTGGGDSICCFFFGDGVSLVPNPLACNTSGDEVVVCGRKNPLETPLHRRREKAMILYIVILIIPGRLQVQESV